MRYTLATFTVAVQDAKRVEIWSTAVDPDGTFVEITPVEAINAFKQKLLRERRLGDPEFELDIEVTPADTALLLG